MPINTIQINIVFPFYETLYKFFAKIHSLIETDKNVSSFLRLSDDSFNKFNYKF